MESTIIGAVGERRQEDPMAKLLKTVMERVERIEAREHEKMPLSNRSTIIWIYEIVGGADSEGPVTRQNPVWTQPSGGENATLWLVIARGRNDTMLVAVQSGDPGVRETSDSPHRGPVSEDRWNPNGKGPLVHLSYDNWNLVCLS